MELFLVRHGHATTKSQDPARPLTDVGADVVRQMATIAARSGVMVDEIRHSGKLRAQQTADILGEALDPSQGVNAVAGLEPEGDVEAMAEMVREEEHRLMLVGHLPFLGRLVGLLVAGNADVPVVRFGTASIVRLIYERGSWSVDWALKPDVASQVV
jgi:phosphohistidine phosphatase